MFARVYDYFYKDIFLYLFIHLFIFFLILSFDTTVYEQDWCQIINRRISFHFKF
jgi:hypothetical protein